VANEPSRDYSNGYEGIAETFMRARNHRIGPQTVREWSKRLAPGTVILDVGCGSGAPISQTLVDGGFVVDGVDASAKMIAAFRTRFPNARAECAPAEESAFFNREYDAIVAWGLLFLLEPENQKVVLHRIAKALAPDGQFLFTAPREKQEWTDSLSDRKSFSLGRDAYLQILSDAGFVLDGEASDEGDNHYFFVSKPAV
jgi:2-polyprenyl-3-methyl-5-hydroxy-6-metoxy-1,4-benzoquinol methylase